MVGAAGILDVTWLSALTFMEALFIMPTRWAQSKRPATDEWTNKMWLVHVLEYYLAIKMNGVALMLAHG